MQTLQKTAAAGPLTSNQERRNTWLACAIIGCVILLYAPVLLSLVRQWWSEPDYSHGFVIPFISAYSLWRRRDALRQVEKRPSWTGMLVIIASLGVLCLGTVGAELFLQRISLLGLIVGATVWLFGWSVVREASFPLALLLLMIPLPGVVYYQIVIPLQVLASRIATGVLHALNLFPVLREGNILVLPSTSLEVAEACSGIRSMFSLLTITAIYAYFAESRNTIRWLLCLLVLPVAVVGNAGRVVFAALSAELAGASSVEGWAHTLSGVFLFVFSTLVIVVCHALISAMWRRFAPGGEHV